MSFANNVVVETITVNDIRPHDQLLIRDGLGYPRVVTAVRIEPMRHPTGHLMVWLTGGFNLQTAPTTTVTILR